MNNFKHVSLGLPSGSEVRIHLQHRSCRRWVQSGRYPGGGYGNWLIFLSESHGHRSLACYSSWGHRESDMTEATLHSMLLVTSGPPSSENATQSKTSCYTEIFWRFSAHKVSTKKYIGSSKTFATIKNSDIHIRIHVSLWNLIGYIYMAFLI